MKNEKREGIKVGPVRKAARITLALVLLSGGLLALPRSASRVGVSDASAQVVPTPTLPPVPIVDPTPVPPPGGGGGGGGSGGSGGSGGGNEAEPKPNPGKESNDDKPSGKNAGTKSTKGAKKKGKGNRGGVPGGGAFVGGPVPSGAFNTDRLVAAAARLRALGMPTAQVIETVYPPFLIAGPASWTNTWGAPRFGPGPLVRTHEGQDVFCKYGDPVLAPELGRVSYSDGGLGGLVARVHTSGSAYWYLAHLSAINNKEFPTGSVVRPGDVIGECGNSGNALTTPPHVHFGYYVNGKAINPMNALVKWLRQAHQNVGIQLSRVQTKVVAQSDRLTVARRFGDDYTSDLSTVAGLQVAKVEKVKDGVASLALAEAELQKLLEFELPDLSHETADHAEDEHDQGSEPGTTVPTGGIGGVVGTRED